MKTVRFFCVFLAITFATQISAQSKTADSDMVSPEQIKKNCWAAYDALNRRDYEAFKKTVVADFVEYSAGPAPIKGIDACLEAYKQFFAMAPDLKFDIKHITVDGNKVIVELTTTGTNTGMVMGMMPPSGKKIKTMDVDMLTVDAKGMALSHATANPNEFFHQIGYGSLTNPNTGAVMAIFEKFQKRDLEGLMALLDDNLSYDGKSHPIIPKEQVMNGKKEFTAWIKEYNEKIQNVKLMPQRILADGDDVMVSLKVDYILKATGKSYTTNLIQHWQFRDGKAIWLRAIGSKPEAIASVTSKN